MPASKKTPAMRMKSQKYAENIEKRGNVAKTLVSAAMVVLVHCPGRCGKGVPHGGLLSASALGACSCTRQSKKEYDYPVGPFVLALFVFVVIGSGKFFFSQCFEGTFHESAVSLLVPPYPLTPSAAVFQVLQAVRTGAPE